MKAYFSNQELMDYIDNHAEAIEKDPVWQTYLKKYHKHIDDITFEIRDRIDEVVQIFCQFLKDNVNNDEVANMSEADLEDKFYQYYDEYPKKKYDNFVIDLMINTLLSTYDHVTDPLYDESYRETYK